MNRTFIAWLLLLSAYSAPIAPTKANEATFFYVDATSGSDANNGRSLSTPWRSISRVNAHTFLPNSNILFKGGEDIRGAIVLTPVNAPGGNIRLGSYGAGVATIISDSSACIAATNVPDLQISNVTCSGAGNTSNATDGILIETDGRSRISGPTISGVTVVGYGVNGINIAGTSRTGGFNNITVINSNVHDVTGNFTRGASACIFIHGFYGRPTTNTNVRVSGNTVHNCTGTATSKNWTGSGIVVAETTGGVIENNIAYDSGANNTHCGGPAGIWAYDSNNLTFQYNEAYRMKTNKAGGGCDGHGFDLDGGMRNSVMQYNWSHDNIGSGFLADAYYDASVKIWFNNVFRFNISQNNSEGEFNISATSTGTRLRVYNNTFYNDYSNDIVSSINSGSMSGIFANNIFYAGPNVPGGNWVNIKPIGSLMFTGNDYFGSDQIKWNSKIYKNVVEWQAATGQEKINGSGVALTADPKLYVYGGGQTTYGYHPHSLPSLSGYQLQAGSSASGGGVNLLAQYDITLPKTDYFGVANLGNNVGASQVAPFTVTSRQAKSFLDRAADLSLSYQILYNALISGEVVDGSWEKLDAEWITASSSADNANLNLVNVKYTLTAHGIMAFYPGHGYKSDGSTGYLDTGFNALTAGENLRLDSAFTAIYILSKRNSNSGVGAQYGASDGTSNIYNFINNSGHDYLAENDAGANVNAPNAAGWTVVNRTALNSVSVFQNGLSLGTVSTIANGTPNANLFLGAKNNAGKAEAFSTDQFSAVVLGGGLGATNSYAFRALSSRINSYMKGLGINVY